MQPCGANAKANRYHQKHQPCHYSWFCKHASENLPHDCRICPNETPGEDALVTGRLTQPPWRGTLEVLTAARKCVSALKVRYCLDRDRLVPKPAELPEELRQSGFGPPVVRRVYIATAGWLTPAELKRRFPEERGASSCPLVLKYLTDVHLDDGPRTMELSHWDLRRLEARAGSFAASK